MLVCIKHKLAGGGLEIEYRFSPSYKGEGVLVYREVTCGCEFKSCQGAVLEKAIMYFHYFGQGNGGKACLLERHSVDGGGFRQLDGVEGIAEYKALIAYIFYTRAYDGLQFGVVPECLASDGLDFFRQDYFSEFRKVYSLLFKPLNANAGSP